MLNSIGCENDPLGGDIYNRSPLSQFIIMRGVYYDERKYVYSY